MTTRPAAHPLRRYGKARARAAGLPVCYTTSGDTTPLSPEPEETAHAREGNHRRGAGPARHIPPGAAALLRLAGKPSGPAPLASRAMAEVLANAPRQPVIWLSFQECTDCSESLTRSFHPRSKT
jgi:hypothetical protein